MVILIGLKYFEIKHVKKTKIPLYLLKEGLVRKCALLATKVESSNNYYYTGLSNS